MGIAPEFVHTIRNRVIQVVLAAFLKRTVALLHRKHPPRHHDDGRWTFARLEVVRKPLRINRGRGNNNFEVWAARQYLAQVAQQKVDVERTLVGLVNDDGVVRVEQRVGLRLGQQNTVGHQLDRRVFA